MFVLESNVRASIFWAKKNVWDGEFHPCPIPFPQPPAEPSDNSASCSSGNGYKATPVI